MPNYKYKIYTLSARAVIGYGKENADGFYGFELNRSATDKCKITVKDEQEDCALFYQILCELHGNPYRLPDEDKLICDLSDIIFYMDFSGIFDRTVKQQKYILRQQKAEAMFRPDGITLDFGSGSHRYLAFERSGSMSRNSRLSFIREDFYEPVRRRIMMDLHIGQCQLSKLYAYNGLMMSSGIRVDGIDIDRPHRIIVIDNPTFEVTNPKVITVEDDGTNSNPRKYHRVEKRIESLKTLCFDGEGLISKEYAAVINRVLGKGRKHTSFQIRMPYTKGMLHQVDFKDFFMSAGTMTITDIWNVEHPVKDVDIILTKSMFKGFSWLRENRKDWNDYWAAFRKYKHALYITGTSKERAEAYTELNFQFLNTLSMTREEFRPHDLPLGWNKSPAADLRDWLTKATEQAYYNLCADEDSRIAYFTDRHIPFFRQRSREDHMTRILKRNPLFLSEPPYIKELEDRKETILSKYSRGKLLVPGDNRYLSGDLFWLVTSLLDPHGAKTKRQRTFFAAAMAEQYPEDAFYAPGTKYEADTACTILRNPHIARNEELQLNPYTENYPMREHYFGHLTDVIMVDNRVLAAERLGGADYDGDMVKTIASPIINRCVQRNYDTASGQRLNLDNIPLLMIPSAEPLVRDANDWQARFETVRNTFASRIGQISNAALNRSIIAYNENIPEKERERYRQEVETLAILTGLEIDAAKSGVRPDLSQYLRTREIPRSTFLRYKYLMDSQVEKSKPYEKTPAEKLREYFEKTDWDAVDSNLERLPYLAYQLKKHTPQLSPKKNSPAELYSFAVPGWEQKLDSSTLSAVSALAQDYKHCLRRIRASRQPIKDKSRQSDIERILYSRGQEDDYDTDSMYALFSALSQERVDEIYNAIRKSNWHLMAADVRELFLQQYLPEDGFCQYYDLLTDFHASGYRILGDLICDCMDSFRKEKQQRLHSELDSPAMTAMLEAYLTKSSSLDYQTAVAKKCRRQLEKIMDASDAVPYIVALEDKDFLWDVLYDKIYDYVRKKEVKRNAE